MSANRRRALPRLVGLLCVAMSIAITTSLASAAGTRVVSGRWSGTTSQGRSISFKVSGKRIKSLTISVHMTSCQFGTPGFDSQIVHVRSIKIKPNGRFKAQRNGQLTSVPTGSTIDNDGAMTIHGRLKGHKGSGQFDFFTFGGHSAESCDSGKVKFKVHH